MDAIGFSTGALARGDFKHGLELQSGRGLVAVELSALRDVELVPLVQAIRDLDLSEFRYVSLHAPSRIVSLPETKIIEILLEHVPRDWPIIMHPDAMQDVEAWHVLGSRLCLENMDQRKAIGRTSLELQPFFSRLPEAKLCLDLGHARQVDPTMSVCFSLLEEYRERIVQVHVSEVNDESRHVKLNSATQASIRRIAAHIPPCPWIIESVIAAKQIDREIQAVKQCLHAPQCLPRMSLVD